VSLVHKPLAVDPKYACNSGYYYDSDLLICIREDITPSRLKEGVSLGAQFNREVAKLRGK